MAKRTGPEVRDVGERHAEETFDFERYEREMHVDRDLDDLETAESPDEEAAIGRAREQLGSREASATSGDGDGDGDATKQVRDKEGSAAAGWTTRIGQGADDDKRKRKARLSPRRRIRRWVIGSVITAMFSLVLAASSFLPNKLDILMQQLHKQFYDRIEHYVAIRTSKFAARYFGVWVFGNKLGIDNCAKEGKPGFTVHDGCFYRVDPINNRNALQKTKIGRAILAWKEAKLEANLAPVSISYSPSSLMPDGSRKPAWVVTIPSGETEYVDPDNPSAGTRRLFDTLDVTGGSIANRGQLYAMLMDAIKRETKSNWITRAIASIHLKRKYGLKRCLFYCDLRSRIDQQKVDIRKAWQGFLSNRIVGSVNARAGLFLGCMFQGNLGCTEDNQEFRTKHKEMIASLTERFGSEKVEDMLKLADEFAKFRASGGSFTKFIINKMMEKIASKLSATGAGAIVNAIPIVGQIIYAVIVGYEVLTIVLLFYNIYVWINSNSPQFASTEIKSAAYTAAYGTMQLATDESRAADGDVFAIEVRGAETDTFHPEKSFLFNSQYANPVGYQNFASIFSKAAYAATEQEEYPYVCDSAGTKMEKDQVVCPNWRFDTPNKVKQLAQNIPGSAAGAALANNDAAAAVQGVANDVVETVDAPFNAASAAAYDASPQSIKDWLERNLGPFSRAAADYIFAPPFTDPADIKDAKLYDATHLGADWTVNDMLRGTLEDDGTQSGYGARVATKAEVQRIDEAYKEKEAEEFASLSLFDKIFSKENTNSFVSQLAMVMPTSITQTLAIFKPSTAFGLASQAFSGSASAAGLAAGAVHGGIPQYVFGSELEKNNLRSETDTKPCANTLVAPNGNLKKIGNSGTADYGLGRAEFTQSNTCILDEMMAHTNTINFTDEPLDPDMISASFTSDTSGTGTGEPTGVYAWPIAESDFSSTTSCYGPRSGGFHYGLDMTGKSGDHTPIRAADGGTVVMADPNNPSAGGLVAIRHANNEYTMYMHMYPDLRVRLNQKVSKGQIIGEQGHFGQVVAGPGGNGSHLHFTYAVGQPRNSSPYAKNPLEILKNAMPAGSSYKSGNRCPIP